MRTVSREEKTEDLNFRMKNVSLVVETQVHCCPNADNKQKLN